MTTLVEYVASLDSTKALDDFAREYYGIKLDGRMKNFTKMSEVFFKKAKDKTPLKQLPFEELLVETDNEVGASKETGSDIQASQEDNQEHLSSGDSDSKPIDEAEEVGEKAEQGLEFGDDFKPAFELNFIKDGRKFSLVHFSVTDYLDALKSGSASLSEMPKQHERHIKTVLWYSRQHGSVMVRETRNSQFIIYKNEDFK